MDRWLCVGAMTVAGLLCLIYGFDLVLPKNLAPFAKSSLLQDAVFVIAGGLVLWQGYETLHELG